MKYTLAQTGRKNLYLAMEDFRVDVALVKVQAQLRSHYNFHILPRWCYNPQWTFNEPCDVLVLPPIYFYSDVELPKSSRAATLLEIKIAPDASLRFRALSRHTIANRRVRDYGLNQGSALISLLDTAPPLKSMRSMYWV